MALHVQQLFVKSASCEVVAKALREYVSEKGNSFVHHSKYRLDGVVQVLNHIVRCRKREFWLFCDGRWTAVWEVVDHTEFADPGIARFLASNLNTYAMWIKLDQDYNIWANQCFFRDNLISEEFLPEAYFLGSTEGDHLYAYGACEARAEEFNRHRSLPAYLITLPALERERSVYNNIEKFIFRIA